MNLGSLAPIIIVVGLILLVGYIAMSQAPIPQRIRRIFQNIRSGSGQGTPPAPRPEAQWEPDPDAVNEARELEKITGAIRKGDAFTITTNDPSHWEAKSFEIQGTITGVAEAETADVTGKFQFRYLTVELPGSSVNTLVIEGDSPTSAVVYMGHAYNSGDRVDEVPIGQVMSKLVEERNRYRQSGLPELPTSLPLYEAGSIVSARYEGHLALLESLTGKSYLPVSTQAAQGQPYTDITVRLDNSGWNVRLVEIGAYSYLLELEPLKLSELTVHHIG